MYIKMEHQSEYLMTTIVMPR